MRINLIYGMELLTVMRLVLPLALALTIVACEEDTTGPNQNQITYRTLSGIDAVSAFAYVDLAANQVVTVTDPLTSTAWDIAFFGTRVKLNGGASGPGGVDGHCLCQNAAATDPEIIAMTPSGEEGDFTAVTAAQVPSAASAWATDVLDPAIEDWWSYNPVTHDVAAVPTNTFAMKLRGTAYAKLHVTNIVNEAMTHAGDVTIEFAVQPTAPDAFGAATTLTVNLAGGPVYVDLVDGAVGSSSDWDIQLSGYDIITNGGVSGTGGVAALVTTQDFASITTVSNIPQAAYNSGLDAFGGVFAASPWYKYNLTGNNLIHPTFDVYLIRKGTQVWKVQITSYYSNAGAARFYTFRSELL